MKTNICAVSLLFRSLIALALFAGSASAQSSYPAKPIYLICSSAAGGTSDLISRAIAQPLSDFLGQPVIVGNQPGEIGRAHV